MTARAWVPLLRALRQAGWEKDDHGPAGAKDHVWRRGGTRNLQEITFNLSGARAVIKPWSVETTELPAPVKAWNILRRIGAFDPAPERLDWRKAA